MPLLFAVDTDQSVQGCTVSKKIYMESDSQTISKSIAELAALIHLWDEVNCIITHSNNNSLTSEQNHQEFAGSFTGNGRVVISESDDFSADTGNCHKYEGENLKQIQNLIQSLELDSLNLFDVVNIEELFKEVFNFFRAISLNFSMIQATEVGNEQYVAMQSLFHEKIEQGEVAFKSEWLGELSEQFPDL